MSSINPVEYLEKHTKLLRRYNQDQKETIIKYWEQIRWTRRNGKLAENVILTELKYWESFRIEDVIKAITVHLNNPQYSKLRENYTRGILRNVDRVAASIPPSSAPSSAPTTNNKNKFHNFTQRSSAYTPEEIKKIGERKYNNELIEKFGSIDEAIKQGIERLNKRMEKNNE